MKERVISLSILIFSLVYLAGAISLSVGTLAQPGPGFMPAGIASGLLVVAGINVWKAFRTKMQENSENYSLFKLAPVGIAVILFVYPIILEPLGYIICTSLVLYILFRLLKYKSRLVSLLTAVAATLVSFYIFANLLGVVLPGGPVEDMILRL